MPLMSAQPQFCGLVQVQLPFPVEVEGAVAEIGQSGGPVLSIRLPYQPYSAALQLPSQPAAVTAQ